jgi:hypothetical protein
MICEDSWDPEAVCEAPGTQGRSVRLRGNQRRSVRLRRTQRPSVLYGGVQILNLPQFWQSVVHMGGRRLYWRNVGVSTSGNKVISEL